jgi:hypothetical protein
VRIALEIWVKGDDQLLNYDDIVELLTGSDETKAPPKSHLCSKGAWYEEYFCVYIFLGKEKAYLQQLLPSVQIE